MEILVRILIIDDDQAFVKRLRDLVAHPQVFVDHVTKIPEDALYHFFVLGGPIQITEAIDKIQGFNEDSLIYLSGNTCSAVVPVRKMIKCNIVDCLDNDSSLRTFVKKISSTCKQKVKMREASNKLDCLKAGDLKSLTRQMKKAESDRFVDYIQNHPLPMVLVSRECDILHANVAMENMIGTKLSGASAATYWADTDELDKAVFDLKEKGQLLGREVTLKNIDGELLLLKLYTSLHNDAEGNWLNTRCLFVPLN